MKKIFFILFLFCLLPFNVFAQIEAFSVPPDEIFEAKVEKVLEEKESQREDGSKVIQQNLLLKGLKGEWKNKEVVFYGISDLDVVAVNNYKEGDRVLVNKVFREDGSEDYYVADFVRQGRVFFLSLLFCVVIILISRAKGWRALLSLLFSFLVILKFIVPRILSGGNPLLNVVLGVFVMMAVIIYLTEKINRQSHVAVLSVFLSLLITLGLGSVFIAILRLTGMAQEETMFLLHIGAKAIDFRGLLLAGIVIGASGVLDDVIIAQIESVAQIKKANPNLDDWQVYKSAYAIGNSHLGSMVNTLFLTYAGASLPLLVLFSVKQEPFLKFTDVINNELIATEIARTLAGSIGLALAMPISTYLAVKLLK